MRIVCWQTILMIYNSLFLSKIRKNVAKFVVRCSRDRRFKGYLNFSLVAHILVLLESLAHVGYIIKKISEYDREIPQSHTADQPMAP